MNPEAIEILGDDTEFWALQSQRLQQLGITIDGLEISHLAFRTETLPEYLVLRQKLERLCSANVENTLNGRQISKLLFPTSRIGQNQVWYSCWEQHQRISARPGSSILHRTR